jgi:hypothetical protein
MNDYRPTDDEVRVGADAIGVACCGNPHGTTIDAELAAAVLAAVLPAARKRWEEDVEAGGLPLIEHDKALILALADKWDADDKRRGLTTPGEASRRLRGEIGADDEYLEL